MKREKKTIFIEASSSKEFEEKINSSLIGIIDPVIQIFGKYEGCIIYTEFIFEDEQKSIADLFEEAGCGATCKDCPYYIEPSDKRKKWIICNNRKIMKDSRACDDYYLERRRNVSEFRKKDEGICVEHARISGCNSDIMVESIPPENGLDEIFAA